MPRILIILPALFISGCASQVPLDRRDEAIAEELSCLSREMSIHVRSNYWGLVALTAISDGGGRKYLGTFMNSHEYRTIVVRKAIFGSGRLGFLLEPLGSNRFAPRRHGHRPVEEDITTQQCPDALVTPMPIGYFDEMDQERRMAGWMIGMRKQVKRLVCKDVRVFIIPAP
jgi:hypothetical protein